MCHFEFYVVELAIFIKSFLTIKLDVLDILNISSCESQETSFEKKSNDCIHLIHFYEQCIEVILTLFYK